MFLRNHKEADSENEARVQPTAATGMNCPGCRRNAGGWGGRGLGGEGENGKQNRKEHILSSSSSLPASSSAYLESELSKGPAPWSQLKTVHLMKS